MTPISSTSSSNAAALAAQRRAQELAEQRAEQAREKAQQAERAKAQQQAAQAQRQAQQAVRAQAQHEPDAVKQTQQARAALAQAERTQSNGSRDTFAQNTRTFDALFGRTAQSPKLKAVTEQAELDRARALYSDPTGKPPSQWTQADAATFTGALAGQLNVAGSDGVKQKLMGLAAGGLRRTSQIFGQATNENGDETAVKQLAANLSSIGNALPKATAAQLAAGLAGDISNDSELHYVDDGMGDYIDGGGSDRFRTLLAGALEAQGKGDAADELVNTSAGSGISLGDVTGAAGGALSDAAHAAPGAVWDGFKAATQAGGGALELEGNALQTASDLTGGLIPSKVSLDPMMNLPGMQAASSALGLPQLPGIDVAQLAKSTGQSIQQLPAALTAAYQATQYRSAIAALGNGDSFALDAGGHLDFDGIRGAAEGQLQVSRGDDGKYTVSVGAQFGGGVGVTLGEQTTLDAGATANLGGSVELSYDNAQDASHAVDVLMATAASAASGPVVGGAADLTGLTHDVFGASPDELPSLAKNVSAVELNASVSGDLLGETGDELNHAAADAGAEIEGSVKLELEDGKPSALVVSQSLSADGSVEARAGGVGHDLGAGGSVTFEQRFTVPDGFQASDLLDPSKLGGIVASDRASLTLEGSVHGGAVTGIRGDVTAGLDSDQGIEGSVRVSGSPLALIRSGAIQAALTGGFKDAARRLAAVSPERGGIEVDGDLRSFTQQTTTGALGFDAGSAGGYGYISSGTTDVANKPLAELDGSAAQAPAGIARLIDALRARVG